MLSLSFSLLFTSCSIATAPEGYLGSQVGLNLPSLTSFSSPDRAGLSGDVVELGEGKQRSYLFNNANPEPFLISNEDNDCSRSNGNQKLNSKRRSKRQSSDMCPFDSFIHSGHKNKPKPPPSASTKGQEGDIEQPSTQLDSKPVPVTQPIQDRNNCDDDVMNVPVCGSLRNIYLDRAVGPWTLLICHLCKWLLSFGLPWKRRLWKGKRTSTGWEINNKKCISLWEVTDKCADNPLVGCLLPETLWCCRSVTPSSLQVSPQSTQSIDFLKFIRTTLWSDIIIKQLLAGETSWEGSDCVSQELVPKYRNRRLQLEDMERPRPF